MNKKLTNKRIIREYDFFKLINSENVKLYDTWEFYPITTLSMFKENVLRKLIEDKKNPMWPDEPNTCNILTLANRYYPDLIYNKNYLKWNTYIDLEGYIWLRSRKDFQKSLLGWGVFTKEL